MKDWTIGKTNNGTYLNSIYSDITIRISNHRKYNLVDIIHPCLSKTLQYLVPLTEFKPAHILWVEDECLTDITAVQYIKQAIQEMI